jgi:Methane oxygenase PmoA
VSDLTTTHLLGRHVELRHRERLLFRYVYAPDVPQAESPRPYFHPLRTLAGDTVTIFRPHDHKWHHGLSMTSAYLSGENFWGGPTFVRDRGYAGLPNNGTTRHEAWEALEPQLVERLAWVTQAGERWLEETRTIGVAVDGDEQWTLRLRFDLRNVAGRPLEFRSPTTEGRPLAGYGGLFWRGPRDFLNGTILAADGREGEAMMGERSPWLAFTGRHDGSDHASTLVFVDHPENPRYPTRWFVRSVPYGCLSPSFMFDEVLPLGAGESLTLRYHVIVGTGEWSRGRVEDVLSGAGGRRSAT